MSARGIFGGVDRCVGSWMPSRFKLRAQKPSFDVASLPMQSSLTSFPRDYDQGQMSSCGPNSVAEVFEFDHDGEKFSRLFLYYFVRATENDIAGDDGVTIADLLAVAHTMGMPKESAWGYDPALLHQAPPLDVFAAAYEHRVDRWDAVADIDHVLYEIANGQPVTFGFQVPTSMQSDECARTGIVQMPTSSTDVVGGHAVNAIGYDRARELVQCTCHWGSAFGDGGTIWLPFAMFTQGLASDFSAIRTVT